MCVVVKFDDAKYSEVKKKESVSSPPPSKPPRSAVSSGASEGLSELDNLLAMLSDTQKHIQSGQGTSHCACYVCVCVLWCFGVACCFEV